eukprot:COSAG04_NODE_14764_length_556_cov_0.636761_2_plen_37_part_01
MTEVDLSSMPAGLSKMEQMRWQKEQRSPRLIKEWMVL